MDKQAHTLRGLARQLFVQHRLTGWHLRLVNLSRFSCTGLCRADVKLIDLDRALLSDPIEFRQTLLHEIAHALRDRRPTLHPVPLYGSHYQGAVYLRCPASGERDGHDAEWVKIARRLGCTNAHLTDVRDTLQVEQC